MIERSMPIHRFARTRALAAIVAAAACLAGCASTTTTETVKVSVEVLDAVRRYEVAYLVQPGDILEVNQYRHAEFTRKVTVRSDGYVSLPVVQEVKASGKTPAELSKLLTDLFGQRLKNPEVTVIVENPPEPVVYVVGQLGTPRALPLRQAKTAAQAIAQSGDATRAASLGNVSVIRLSDEGVIEAHTVHMEGMGSSQPERYMALSTMLLKPNDLVLVPESYRSQLVQALQDTSTILSPILNVLILRQVYR